MNDELLLKIAENAEAVKLLSPELQAAIGKVVEKNQQAKRDKEILEDRRRKAKEEQEKYLEDTNAKLLCKGEWGENVPRNRRFVLCSRMGSEFKGWAGQERDPTKWVPIKQYCAIDLVRGIMAPYWNYYGANIAEKQAWLFVEKKIKPVWEAATEEELISKLRLDWDFFHIKDKMDSLFRVVEFEGTDFHTFKITKESEEMLLEEHQARLKAEFGVKGE